MKVLLIVLLVVSVSLVAADKPKKKNADKNKFTWQQLEVSEDIYDQMEDANVNKEKAKCEKEEGIIYNYCRCNFCQATGYRVYYKTENHINIVVKVECPYCHGEGFKKVYKKGKKK